MSALTKYIPVDQQRVDGLFIKGTITAIAVDINDTHRMHVDFIRMRGQVVLVAGEVIANRDNLFPRFLERVDFAGDFLQFA